MNGRLEPRQYQIDAYRRMRAAAVAGAAAGLLVMPTGGGKTLTASIFAEGTIARGKAVEVLAPRAELVDQARATFTRQGLDLRFVRFGTIQSAASSGTAEQVGGRPVGLLWLDEAHHYGAGAEAWSKCAEHRPGRFVFGTTATAARGDGGGLGRASGGPFDVLIDAISIAELTAMGVLVPVLTYAPKSPVKDKISVEAMVAAYASRLAGKRAICYCAGVRGAELATMAFVRAGFPAACLHGDTQPHLRAARLAAFATQSTQQLLLAGSLDRPPIVLCNDQLLTEGLDVTSIEGIILGRGVGHAGAMIQIAGRGLRAHPGKDKLIFIDLPGVTRRRDRHGRLKIGLPEQPRIWTLDGKVHEVDEEEAAKPIHTCPACEVSFARHKTDDAGWRCCPICKVRINPPQTRDEATPRPLHAYGSGASEDDKQRALYDLAMQSARKGHGDGDPRHAHSHRWIAYRLQEMFGGAQLPYQWTADALADAMLELRTPGKRKPRQPKAEKPPSQRQQEAAEWAAYLAETAAAE